MKFAEIRIIMLKLLVNQVDEETRSSQFKIDEKSTMNLIVNLCQD